MEPHDEPSTSDTHDGESTSAGTPENTHESVAAALRELEGVGELALDEHPDAFARIHSGLQQALSGVDDA